MKNIIVLCSVIAFLGNIIKTLVDSSKKEGLLYIINVFIGISIILIILQSVTVKDVNNCDNNLYPIENYSSIREATFEDIIEHAEFETEEKITSQISSKFGLVEARCDIEICNENLKVDSARIFLNSHDMISGYEVKKYLESEYNIEVEVYFF